MKCTEFMKGLALGMLAGGAVACLMTFPKKKRCGVAGRILKAAGHVVENLSEAFGI